MLLGHIIQFVADRYGETWSEDNAAEALLGFLSDFSIDCIRTLGDRPFVVSDRLREFDARFMVGMFIRASYENRNADFDLVMEVVKGTILANALLCQDLAQLPAKLARVRFYLDTPLLLDLTGATGEYSQAVVREWTSLVKRLGGSVRTFEHLVAETEAVLESCERTFSNPPAHDRIVNAMRRGGKGPSDIALLRGDIGRHLQEEGVTIKATPQRNERYQIDEEAFGAALENQMRYWNRRALDTDVSSVAAIYQLRAGNRPRDLEHGRAFLVTSNNRLATASLGFGRSQGNADEMATVITDYSLANVAWLKSPFSAPQLPQLEVIAECYAFMRPPEELWTEYLKEVDKLMESGGYEESDLAVLRYSLEAQDELMQLTRGSDDRLEQATIQEVLERAKGRIAEEEKRNTEAERGKARELEARLLEISDREESRKVRQKARSRRIAWWLSMGVVLLLGAALAAVNRPGFNGDSVV